MSQKSKNIIRIIATLMVLALTYQQCGMETGIEDLASDAGLGSNEVRQIDLLQEPKPALVCGPDGYQYIVRNYLKTNCGDCHTTFSQIPHTFTHDDANTAFSEAMGVPAAKWRETITHNNFCGPNCNLSTRGEVYAAISEWLDNRVACP